MTALELHIMLESTSQYLVDNFESVVTTRARRWVAQNRHPKNLTVIGFQSMVNHTLEEYSYRQDVRHIFILYFLLQMIEEYEIGQDKDNPANKPQSTMFVDADDTSHADDQ